jgi:YD repeat-containing protein
LLAPTYQAASGIRYVSDGSTQSGGSQFASGQSAQVLPQDSIPGDALVAFIYSQAGDADDVTSVSGLGGDWHQAASETNDGDDEDDSPGELEVWYALDVSGGSEDLTVNETTGDWIAWVGEYSGVDPSEGFVSANTESGNSHAPDVTVDVDSGDLAVVGASANGLFTASPYSSWVLGSSAGDFSPFGGATTAYQVAGSDGSVDASWAGARLSPGNPPVDWATIGIVLAPSSDSRGGGDTTDYAYDELGRLVCEAPPDATSAGVGCPDDDTRVPGTTTWAYDDDSEVTSETDPDGNTTDYSYDADGNQTEVTDGLGNITKTTYDADDRISTVTQGYGTDSASTTSNTYDITPDDCPADVTGTTYCTQVENGLSETTTDYYNSVNEVIEQDPPNTSDETPTTYTYDPVGERRDDDERIRDRQLQLRPGQPTRGGQLHGRAVGNVYTSSRRLHLRRRQFARVDRRYRDNVL